MSQSTAVSVDSVRQAAAFLDRLKPQVAEVLERHRTQGMTLKFSDIEADGASVGDLIARMVIDEAVKLQPSPTEAEELEARQAALSKADPKLAAPYRPEDLRLTHIPDKVCTLGTVRGPLAYRRTYLYFPDLRVGVFPPRPAAGRPGREADAAGRASRTRTRGGGRLPE